MLARFRPKGVFKLSSLLTVFCLSASYPGLFINVDSLSTKSPFTSQQQILTALAEFEQALNSPTPLEVKEFKLGKLVTINGTRFPFFKTPLPPDSSTVRDFAEDYFSGKAQTDPFPTDFRPTVENDFESIQDLSSEKRGAYLLAGINALIEGKIAFLPLAAGASTRMRPSQAPEEIKERARQISTQPEPKTEEEEKLRALINSKGGLPVGELNGEAVTYYSYHLLGLRNLSDQIEKLTGKRIPIPVITFTNQNYKTEWLTQLALMENCRLPIESFSAYTQTLGPIVYTNEKDSTELLENEKANEANLLAELKELNSKVEAGKESAEKILKKQKEIEQSRQIQAKLPSSIARAKQIKQQLAEGVKTPYFVPNADTPLGHGWALHDMVRSGMLRQILNQGIERVFIFNVDNMGAINSDTLIKIGMSLVEGIDILPELSKRTENQKGGGAIFFGTDRLC